MSNQFHRLLTESELHRPERTGFGDPNLKTFTDVNKSSFSLPAQASQNVSIDDLIFNPEDGQLYQDLNTGDLYRYIKFGAIPLEGTQGTFIGTMGSSKAKDTEADTISITNSDARTDNGLSVVKGQKISIQSQNGDIQIVRASETQTFVSPSFTLKVNPFFYEFDAGDSFSNPTDVVSFNSDGVWEKFIEFEKSTGRITNVAFKEGSDSIGIISEQFGGEIKIVSEIPGATIWIDRGTNLTFDTFEELKAYLIENNSPTSEWSGRITSRVIEPTQETSFIARDVTEIKANLYAQVTEGEEITVYNPATGDVVKLTINNDGNNEITSYGPAENITIDIQDDKIRPIFPVGSLVFGEEGFRESSLKVDPSRIQLNVLGGRGGDGIGTLVNAVGVGTTTQLSLKDIDEAVSLADNQSMILTNKFGDTKKFTVNGAQTLTTGTDTLNVDSIVIASGEPTFDADSSFVKEPSYSSSSRITVAEGNINLAVQDANDALNATASLDIRVDALEGSSITNAVTWNDSSGFTRLSAGPEGSAFVVQADQISINGTTTFGSGYDPSTKETPSGAQSKADSARNQARENLASNLGYANYSDMVSEAQAGKTIISGGFIRTSLIDADAILANFASITSTLTIGSGGEIVNQAGTYVISDAGISITEDIAGTSQSYTATFDGNGLDISSSGYLSSDVTSYYGVGGFSVIQDGNVRVRGIIPPAGGVRTFEVNDVFGGNVFGVLGDKAISDNDFIINGDLDLNPSRSTAFPEGILCVRTLTSPGGNWVHEVTPNSVAVSDAATTLNNLLAALQNLKLITYSGTVT